MLLQVRRQCNRGGRSTGVGLQSIRSWHPPELLRCLPVGATGHQRCCANKVSRAFSTIGAGDTFIAGVLSRMHAGTRSSSWEDALGFAVGLATKKVQQEGFAGLVAY